jgi:DNA-binding MarR family transcriptional regulator
MRIDVLESLVVSAHRLTQLAAQATGDKTPAAAWRTLSVLEREGAQRVGELAALSRVTQPGMTRLVGNLHDDGLVVRTGDPEDSRASVIGITPAGRTALLRWRRTIAETMAPAFGSLDDDDWHALSRAAEILAARTVAPAGAAL